jgi:hypothetical protein
MARLSITLHVRFSTPTGETLNLTLSDIDHVKAPRAAVMGDTQMLPRQRSTQCLDRASH